MDRRRGGLLALIVAVLVALIVVACDSPPPRRTDTIYRPAPVDSVDSTGTLPHDYKPDTVTKHDTVTIRDTVPGPERVVVRVDSVHTYWRANVTGSRVVYDLAAARGEKPQNFSLPAAGRDTVAFFPNRAADSVVFALVPWSGLAAPQPFRLPTVVEIKRDTVLVVRVDTVWRERPPAPNTAELRIDDSAPGHHTGEMNVWQGATYLGRVGYSGSYASRMWWAWRAIPREMSMPRSPVYFRDSLSAMRALVGASWSAPTATSLGANDPELPRVQLETRMAWLQ
jgi:hypothetical protein